jgi:hypothetical protein
MPSGPVNGNTTPDANIYDAACSLAHQVSRPRAELKAEMNGKFAITTALNACEDGPHFRDLAEAFYNAKRNRRASTAAAAARLWMSTGPLTKEENDQLRQALSIPPYILEIVKGSRTDNERNALSDATNWDQYYRKYADAMEMLGDTEIIEITRYQKNLASSSKDRYRSRLRRNMLRS